MKEIKNPQVAAVFRGYPGSMRKKLLFLRQLILDTALEADGIGALEETLKWGEPSYLSKGGSAVRIDWKPKNPLQHACIFIAKQSWSIRSGKFMAIDSCLKEQALESICQCRAYKSNIYQVHATGQLER